MSHHADLYVRTLLRAAEQAGGVEALGKRLGLPVDLLSRYLDGSYPISERIFLDAVDVLMEREEVKPASSGAPARPARNP